MSESKSAICGMRGKQISKMIFQSCILLGNSIDSDNQGHHWEQVPSVETTNELEKVFHHWKGTSENARSFLAHLEGFPMVESRKRRSLARRMRPWRDSFIWKRKWIIVGLQSKLSLIESFDQIIRNQVFPTCLVRQPRVSSSFFGKIFREENATYQFGVMRAFLVDCDQGFHLKSEKLRNVISLKLNTELSLLAH